MLFLETVKEAGKEVHNPFSENIAYEKNYL